MCMCVCVYTLYAFSKHEEQTLVRSERANAREKKSLRKKKEKRNTTEKAARRAVFLLIIQLILSFCRDFFSLLRLRR